MAYPNLYECSSCKAKVWKISHGREFKDNEAKKLFKGETITAKGFRSSQNSLYDTKVKLVDKEIKLIFDEQTKPTTMFKCSCKGDVVKIKGGYKCSSCDKIIWERFLNKLLTFRQVKRLFKGDDLTLNNLRSSRGNVFNAQIFHNGDELSLEYL